MKISPNDGVKRLREAGVDVFLGEGRFVGRDAVEVAEKTLTMSRAIIAAGAARGAGGVGLTGRGYLTNETVFWLTELPKRLAVIGAGPVGCELRQAFARFGSRRASAGGRASNPRPRGPRRGGRRSKIPPARRRSRQLPLQNRQRPS